MKIKIGEEIAGTMLAGRLLIPTKSALPAFLPVKCYYRTSWRTLRRSWKGPPLQRQCRANNIPMEIASIPFASSNSQFEYFYCA